MENPLVFFVNAVLLSVLFFSAHVLLLRSVKKQVYLPLAVCMLCIAVLMCEPTTKLLSIQWQITFLILSLPAALLIPPCFWFYAKGLTSETRWQLMQENYRHWLMPGMGAIVAVIALLLPDNIQYGLLAIGNADVLDEVNTAFRYFVFGVLALTFVLVLGWVFQSGFYLYKIIRLLNHYRLRLKDVFASTEEREIRWLGWLLLAVGIVWLGTAVDVILENLVYETEPDPIWVNLVVLVMVWSLAVWGLRQKPGFEELYEGVQATETEHGEQAESEKFSNHSPETEKYRRSALNDQQSSRIAEKITSAMADDRLYLDPSLSLPKLAKHIGASGNYISQTLNATLGVSFFDLVNRYRIDAAKRLLRETDDTILDIAMAVGFNAKSSFYTAFKKETLQTPNQYRKQYSDNA